jgi:hypothetical protein
MREFSVQRKRAEPRSGEGCCSSDLVVGLVLGG